jgi:DNA-directed RNA polymerase specialized sigma24 family protein
VDETHDNSDAFDGAGGDSAFGVPNVSRDDIGAGSWSESEHDESVELRVRFRGDEPELYLKFNRLLVAKIDHAVVSQREDVEDACAFAWVQFLRHQPDRDQNWQGWLFRTAQHEAWRLTAIRRSELRLRNEMPDRGLTDPDHSADPARRLEQRQQFEEAIIELKQIPKPMQEVVLVASQVRRHRDVGEILDIPETRVGYLLASASAALGQAAERRTERERPVASPRAARLRELEDAPPEWLVEAVGRPPTRGKNASASILAWRRAALAIDDYRHDHGWVSPYEGLGPKPTDDLVARRAHDGAQQAIERVSVERARRRGNAIER